MKLLQIFIAKKICSSDRKYFNHTGHCWNKKGRKVLAFLRIFLCFTTATTRSATVKAFLSLYKARTEQTFFPPDINQNKRKKKIISATVVLSKSHSFRLVPSRSVNTTVTFEIVFSSLALNILWRRPIKQQKLCQCSHLWRLTNDSAGKQYHSANITLNDLKVTKRNTNWKNPFGVFYSPKECPLCMEKVSMTVTKTRCLERHQDEKFHHAILP